MEPRTLAILLLTGLIVCLGCSAEQTVEFSELGPDEVAVAAVHPPDLALDLTEPIRITFTQDVAPDTLAPGSYLERPPASIAPELEGVWKWGSRARLEFIPDLRYEPATRYTLALDPAIGAARGLTLRGPRVMSFQSVPLKVTDTQLYLEPVSGSQRTYDLKGTFSFNLPVAAETFAAHLRLNRERRGMVAFELDTSGAGESQSFHARIQADDKDEDLVAMLASGLQPAAGEAPLRADERATITIPSFRRLSLNNLQMRALAPDETSGEPAKLVVLAHFSDAVDHEQIERHLHIEPELPDLRIETEGYTARLFGSFALDTRYAVRFDRELESIHGLSLERDFESSVHLEALPPSIRVAASGNILSLRGARTLGIETINVDTLNVEIDRIYPNNLVHFLHDGSIHQPGADVSRPGYAERGRSYGHGAFRLWQLGTTIDRFDLPTAAGEPNAAALTALPLATRLGPDARGVFRVTLRKADERRIGDARLIAATDLGIIAKQADDEILVAVASIARIEPLPGVRVEVLSYQNQSLATGTTGAAGTVRLRPASRDDSHPFVIVATLGADLGFLAFKDTAVPTGDLDVGGVAHTRAGAQAFIYADRGIYRPGDRAHLAWIVRDRRLELPGAFPLTLRITDPNGRVFTERRVTTGELGHSDTTFEVPDWAPTGTYGITLELDRETQVGRSSIRVEDFMPDRMKVELALLVDNESRELARPGDPIAARLTATTLFGPPAAGRDARARLRVTRAPIRFDGWQDFAFGDPTDKLAVTETDLGDRTTGAEGIASWDVEVPPTADFHGWLRAEVTVEVTELGGGRSVGDRRSLVVSPVDYLIGMRQVTEATTEGDNRSSYAEPGQPIPFEIALVDLDGNVRALSDSARATVIRRRYRTVLRMDSQGRYRYISELDEEALQTLRVGAGVRPSAPGRPSRREGAVDLSVTVDRHGSYRLVVEDPVRNARSSLIFHVYGWGYAPWAMSAPEKVQIRLDKESYSAGEIARAQIEAPFPGLLLLTVERDRVETQRWVRLESNSAVVEVPIEPSLFPNSYVVATLLRPLDSVEAHAPARAFGAAPLFLDRAQMTMQVELETPRVMRPRGKLAVRYRVAPAAPDTARSRAVELREPVTLTIAAVDEGILQITDFATPSPLDFFCARRRLSVSSFDTWSLLMPEFDQIARRSRPGGGVETQRRNLNPIAVKRVKPVALWSGLLRASADWQTIALDVPAFNGALRVMAVAAADRRFGSNAELVRVRDPIVLTPNLPRVLAPGDEIDVPVQVYNGLAEDVVPPSPGVFTSVPIRVTAELEGPVELMLGGGNTAATDTRGIVLEGGKEGVVHFRVRAGDAIGSATFRFIAEAVPPDGVGERVEVATELAVRPPRPLEARATSGVVKEGEAATLRLSEAWYPQTATATVTVSPLPVARVASGLTYLLRYPYGCIEQTTSRAFPLLYFADLARTADPEAFGSNDAAYYVNSAIDRIAAMQIPAGGFSFWPGGNEAEANAWAGVYATHFLVEARQNGFVVPDRVIDEALAFLVRIARATDGPWFRGWSSRSRLSTRGYALYVLARAGLPERGVMDQLAEDALGDLLPAARYHLAGAYGLAGNLTMMRELLPATAAAGPPIRATGPTWTSRARDDAIMLDVLATLDPEHRQVPILLERLLAQARDGRWHNTHENGWAFMALGKLARHAQQSATAEGKLELAGDIRVDGEVVTTITADGAAMQSDDWLGREVEIRLRGGGLAYYSVVDEGVPRGPLDRDVVANGLVVTREYLDLEGTPVDLGALRQGDVVIARIGVAAPQGDVDNVVVVDLVPAGLEIENPRLSDRGGPAWTRGSTPLRVDYIDVRDDRLLVFTSAARAERVFFYGLRVVTAGDFVLPPIKAEAMYDPAVRSVRGAGRVHVVAP